MPKLQELVVSTSLKNRKVNYVSSSHFYVWNPVTSIILHFKIHCHLKKTGKKTEKQCKKKHVSSPMRKTAPGISVQAKVRCCPPRDTWKPPFLGGQGPRQCVKGWDWKSTTRFRGCQEMPANMRSWRVCRSKNCQQRLLPPMSSDTQVWVSSKPTSALGSEPSF